MSKFCTKCGKELPNDAKFCKECGTQCENFVQVSRKSEEKVVSNNKKGVNPTVVIIAAMVLITVIIVVLISVIGMKSSKNNESKEVDTNEIAVVEDKKIQPPLKEDIQEDITDDETSGKTSEQTSDEDNNTSRKEQVPDNPEQPNQPDQFEDLSIIDYDTAFKKFVEDPYLNRIPFPGYGDFVSIESQNQFGMAVLINVDEEYVKSYATEETPRNGYTQNIFETSENGVYQYIADNGKGQTCQVIYNKGKMMILVGESSAFDR